MRRLLPLLMLVVVACDPANLDVPAVGLAGEDTAIVASITDGDTFRATLDGQSTPIRLTGIDTPETRHPNKGVECFGRESTEALARMLPVRSEVRLVYDVERLDRYDRTLAYVYSGSTFVNLELVRQGYAQVSTHPPNVRFAEDFVRAAAEAREAGRGLWSAC